MNRWIGPFIGVVLGVTSVAVSATPAAPPCDLPPLVLPLFGGTPVARVAATLQPIGEVTKAEMERTLTTWVACVNTGDPKLAWAMFSPTWFQQSFADPRSHYFPTFEHSMDEPIAPPAEPLVLVSVDDMSASDDRLIVTATFSSGQERWTDQMVIVRIDGRLMIERVSST